MIPTCVNYQWRVVVSIPRDSANALTGIRLSAIWLAINLMSFEGISWSEFGERNRWKASERVRANSAVLNCLLRSRGWIWKGKVGIEKMIRFGLNPQNGLCGFLWSSENDDHSSDTHEQRLGQRRANGCNWALGHGERYNARKKFHFMMESGWRGIEACSKSSLMFGHGESKGYEARKNCVYWLFGQLKKPIYTIQLYSHWKSSPSSRKLIWRYLPFGLFSTLKKFPGQNSQFAAWGDRSQDNLGTALLKTLRLPQKAKSWMPYRKWRDHSRTFPARQMTWLNMTIGRFRWVLSL
jgi:hypothetical protein